MRSLAAIAFALLSAFTFTVAQDKPAHRWSANVYWDFVYNVGRDTGTPVADKDYFAITVPATADLRIETFDGTGMACTATDTVIRLFAADGTTVVDGPRLFQNQLEGGRLRTPRSVAFNAELDRELRLGWMLRIGYQQREGRREYVLNPFDDLAGVPTLLLSPAGRSRYREFQLTSSYRFGKRNHLLTASYVRSAAEGNLNLYQQFFGNFEDPIIRPDERARLGFDVPNRFLFWGEVTIPFKIILAPVLEIRDGFPFSLLDETRNFVGPRNLAGRYPLFTSFDIQVLRDFKFKAFGSIRRLRVGFKVFNLFKRFNPRDFQNNLDALDTGTFYNSRGRLFRGKLLLDL